MLNWMFNYAGQDLHLLADCLEVFNSTADRENSKKDVE